MMDILVTFINQIKANKVSFLLAFVALGTIIGPLRFPQPFYLASLLVFMIAYMKQVGKMNGPWMFLLIVACLSLLLNDWLPLFKAWQRLALFVFVTMPISPLFHSPNMEKARIKTFNFVLILSFVVAVSSVICYFLGINYMTSHSFEGDSLDEAGIFGGITIHSMLLGPISAVGATYVTWRFSAVREVTKKQRFIYLSLIFSCFAAVLLSASRGSTVAAAVGSSVVFLLREGKVSTKMISGIVGILLTGLIAQPLLEPFTKGIKEKQSNNVSQGSTFSSRESKWTTRLDEFTSSPIWGIGFATVSKESGDYSGKGVIEPGSSWLAVLSMTGILGALAIVLIVFVPIVKIFRRLNHTDVLLFGIFCVFLIHMATEGYIFAAGGFLFFYFWLYVGAAYACLKNPDVEIF